MVLEMIFETRRVKKIPKITINKTHNVDTIEDTGSAK